MAGHSKWANIKHRKGAQDAKRGKVFTKHAKLITIAARAGGGDLEMNSTLRMLVQKAKKDNMPNDNIDKAIKKGTGEIKDDVIISEIIYEGYGVDGVAFYIQALTENNNRTLASVRTIMSKNGGSLGTAGCVAYNFDRKGVFVFEAIDKDQVEELAIMNGAEDIEESGEAIIVYTEASDYKAFSEAVEASGLEPLEFELRFEPKTKTDITDSAIAEKNLKIVDLLEDDDDVQTVSTNMNILCDV